MRTQHRGGNPQGRGNHPRHPQHKIPPFKQNTKAQHRQHCVRPPHHPKKTKNFNHALRGGTRQFTDCRDYWKSVSWWKYLGPQVFAYVCFAYLFLLESGLNTSLGAPETQALYKQGLRGEEANIDCKQFAWDLRYALPNPNNFADDLFGRLTGLSWVAGGFQFASLLLTHVFASSAPALTRKWGGLLGLINYVISLAPTLAISYDPDPDHLYCIARTFHEQGESPALPTTILPASLQGASHWIDWLKPHMFVQLLTFLGYNLTTKLLICAHPRPKRRTPPTPLLAPNEAPDEPTQHRLMRHQPSTERIAQPEERQISQQSAAASSGASQQARKEITISEILKDYPTPLDEIQLEVLMAALRKNWETLQKLTPNIRQRFFERNPTLLQFLFNQFRLPCDPADENATLFNALLGQYLTPISLHDSPRFPVNWPLADIDEMLRAYRESPEHHRIVAYKLQHGDPENEARSETFRVFLMSYLRKHHRFPDADVFEAICAGLSEADRQVVIAHLQNNQAHTHVLLRDQTTQLGVLLICQNPQQSHQLLTSLERQIGDNFEARQWMLDFLQGRMKTLILSTELLQETAASKHQRTLLYLYLHTFCQLYNAVHDTTRLPIHRPTVLGVRLRLFYQHIIPLEVHNKIAEEYVAQLTPIVRNRGAIQHYLNTLTAPMNVRELCDALYTLLAEPDYCSLHDVEACLEELLILDDGTQHIKNALCRFLSTPHYWQASESEEPLDFPDDYAFLEALDPVYTHMMGVLCALLKYLSEEDLNDCVQSCIRDIRTDLPSADVLIAMLVRCLPDYPDTQARLLNHLKPPSFMKRLGCALLPVNPLREREYTSQTPETFTNLFTWLLDERTQCPPWEAFPPNAAQTRKLLSEHGYKICHLDAPLNSSTPLLSQAAQTLHSTTYSSTHDDEYPYDDLEDPTRGIGPSSMGSRT